MYRAPRPFHMIKRVLCGSSDRYKALIDCYMYYRFGHLPDRQFPDVVSNWPYSSVQPATLRSDVLPEAVAANMVGAPPLIEP